MASIEPGDLTDHVRAEPGPAGARNLKSLLEEVERELIVAALRESRGNKAKAARALGISARLMGIRVNRLSIDWRGLRPGREQAADTASPPR